MEPHGLHFYFIKIYIKKNTKPYTIYQFLFIRIHPCQTGIQSVSQQAAVSSHSRRQRVPFTGLNFQTC